MRIRREQLLRALPQDFATIYNVLPLWNAGIDGTGQTIAVVGDSNINMQDVVNFPENAGLPAAKLPPSPSRRNSTDPGITDDEIESDLDVQWSGRNCQERHNSFRYCRQHELDPS